MEMGGLGKERRFPSGMTNKKASGKGAPKLVTVEASAGLTVLQTLHSQIAECALCPRLREYGENIGRGKGRASMDEKARIQIVGLAPGAHGANRTGRPFTGDGAGNFMYPVLAELGLATHGNA